MTSIMLAAAAATSQQGLTADATRITNEKLLQFVTGVYGVYLPTPATHSSMLRQ
jgi:hypothetical protein